MRKLASIFLSMLVLCQFVSAQNTDTYKKDAAEIRKQVWAWNMPEFQERKVPASYASQSKVVLARHIDLTADSKSKLAFYGLGFGSKKELTITEIVRELVSLNDKNAVTEYSELSYTQFEKNSGFIFSEKSTTYIGLRIIKPDGSMKEVNTDEIVLTKNESKEKKAKLAVSDLQPGDILDYFIATEQSLVNNYDTKKYRLPFFDDAPIQHFSFHGQLGKKYAIEYRSFNGAPEIKVDKNEDKDIIVDVQKNNIPPFETSLWVAVPKQLPYISMDISMGYRGIGAKALGTSKPGEITKITDGQPVMDDKASAFSSKYYSGYWMKAAKAQYDEVESDAKSYAKKQGLSYKDMSDAEKAAQLYYTVRFTKILKFSIDALSEKVKLGEAEYDGLPSLLFFLFKAAGLDPAILISETRMGPRMNEAVDPSDLFATTYIPSIRKFFSIKSVFDVPFIHSEEVDGLRNNKSFTFDHPAAIMSMKKMEGLTNVGPGIDVPATKSTDNAHIEKLDLSLNAEKTGLLVDRTTTLRGFSKVDAQRKLILYEDLYEYERKALGEPMSLIEELEDSKKGKKVVDEVKNAFAEARKKQKDAFEKDAKDWFEQEVTELKNYKTVNLGVRHTAPDFIYSSSFNLGGLVKKAGNNLVVEIGKIQGQPFTVKKDQRKRSIDAYMPPARSIEYAISFNIPEGYVAEGIEALNSKTENASGYFITEASTDGKTVKISLRKHYLHSFEPVSTWDNILAFTDAANNWTAAKLLLRKK